MAREIYQASPPNDLTLEELVRIVSELNTALFALSRRVGELDIESKVDLSSATTVADLVTALEDAGIGDSNG